MYACVHDQCSLVCVHLAFVSGLKGCKLRMRIQHLSMNKYIPLVSAIPTLNIDILALGYLLSTYSCWVRPHLSALFLSTVCTGLVVWSFRSSSLAAYCSTS